MWFQPDVQPETWVTGLTDDMGNTFLPMFFRRLRGPWRLALDRTQWKLGRRDVNILMLALVTWRARVPLMWSAPDNNGGTSDRRERIAMQRYLAIFGAASIRPLLADREFVSLEWMSFLHENNIPFAIRMRRSWSSPPRTAAASPWDRCLGSAAGSAASAPPWAARPPGRR